MSLICFSRTAQALLLVLLSSALFAQDYRARVQGTITDSSTAAVPGAKITLLNSKTGAAVTRQSAETGHYLFDLVEPGVYTLSVELTGFNKFVQESLNVASRSDVTV